MNKKCYSSSNSSSSCSSKNSSNGRFKGARTKQAKKGKYIAMKRLEEMGKVNKRKTKKKVT